MAQWLYINEKHLQFWGIEYWIYHFLSSSDQTFEDTQLNIAFEINDLDMPDELKWQLIRQVVTKLPWPTDPLLVQPENSEEKQKLIGHFFTSGDEDAEHVMLSVAYSLLERGAAWGIIAKETIYAENEWRNSIQAWQDWSGKANPS